jgi:hypothetical protein
VLNVAQVMSLRKTASGRAVPSTTCMMIITLNSNARW